MNIGFIGLGHMGGPMSRNVLAAGYDLVVHDVHREAAAELEAAGAAWAATPRETGAGREVVITMLPTPPIVEQVLLGENGLLSVLSRGDYDESFALALACKDLDLAGQVGVPVELSAVVEQVYRRARAQYGDAGGEMLPIKLYEDLTGTPLRLSAQTVDSNPVQKEVTVHDDD